jgi:hypothetical protein
MPSAFTSLSLWSVFEYLLDISRFLLHFAGDAVSLSARFHIGIVTGHPKTFFHATLHLTQFAFRLIDRAILHRHNITSPLSGIDGGES